MSEDSILKVEEAGKLQRQQAVPAYVLIGVGVALLAANLFGYHLMNILWPGFILVPGLLMLWPAYTSTADRESPFMFMAIPGAMVTTVGLLLAVMNLTGHFEAWAYSWTLVIASVPAAIMYMNRFKPTAKIHESGRQFIRVMVIMFMVLAVFFEVLIFNSLNPWLPLALIGYGAYLLLKSRREAAA